MYTLSGTVTEVAPTGRIPIQGVSVDAYRCDLKGSNCELESSTTDINGVFKLRLNGGWNLLWVAKAGYVWDGPPRVKRLSTGAMRA